MKKEGTMSICTECNKEFYIPPSARRSRNYCSRICRAKGQSKWQTRDLVTRFWSKVDKSESCWLWTGAKLRTGYGSIRINNKAERAHRVAYELSVGKIPHGMLILHSCDNPLCVNPAHLRVGDKMENTKDALERGQHVFGERHFACKLSFSDVTTIKAALSVGVTGRYLSKKFNVSEGIISSIKHGKKRRYG